MARTSEYPRYRKVILRVIEWNIKENGKSPSMREISDACGISIGATKKYVDYLQQEGLVTCKPRRHRSIRLSSLGEEMLTSPR